MSWLEDNFDNYLAEDYANGFAGDKKACYDVIREIKSDASVGALTVSRLKDKLGELRERIDEVGLIGSDECSDLVTQIENRVSSDMGFTFEFLRDALTNLKTKISQIS